MPGASRDGSAGAGILHFTVSKKLVVCCSEPLVAVTVMVAVTGGRVVLLAKVAPPHPFSRHKPVTLTTRSSSSCRPRRLFHPMKHSATASTEPGNSGVEFRCRAADVVVVVTVSVVDAGAPDGVTVAGAKLHDAPAGRPVQLNPTAELNPFDGVTVMAAVPLRPPVTDIAVGEVTTEKSGAGRLMV